MMVVSLDKMVIIMVWLEEMVIMVLSLEEVVILIDGFIESNGGFSSGGFIEDYDKNGLVGVEKMTFDRRQLNTYV